MLAVGFVADKPDGCCAERCCCCGTDAAAGGRGSASDCSGFEVVDGDVGKRELPVEHEDDEDEEERPEEWW